MGYGWGCQPSPTDRAAETWASSRWITRPNKERIAASSRRSPYSVTAKQRGLRLRKARPEEPSPARPRYAGTARTAGRTLPGQRVRELPGLGPCPPPPGYRLRCPPSPVPRRRRRRHSPSAARTPPLRGGPGRARPRPPPPPPNGTQRAPRGTGSRAAGSRPHLPRTGAGGGGGNGPSWERAEQQRHPGERRRERVSPREAGSVPVPLPERVRLRRAGTGRGSGRQCLCRKAALGLGKTPRLKKTEGLDTAGAPALSLALAGWEGCAISEASPRVWCPWNPADSDLGEPQ